MTSFSTSAVVSKPSPTVIDSAVATLSHLGFQITQRDARSVTLTGPGLNSTRQHPLLGASTITVRIQGGELAADAELGGVDRMQRFLTRFPFTLGLCLGLFFGIGGGFLFGQLFGVGFGVPWVPGWQWLLLAMGGALLPVTPWFVLSPLMSRRIRARTHRAIETLIRNATFPTEPAPQM